MFDIEKFAIWLHENLKFMYTRSGAKFNLPTWTAERKAEQFAKNLTYNTSQVSILSRNHKAQSNTQAIFPEHGLRSATNRNK